MANSSLATYTKISPNRTTPRNHTIDRITPHCYVGQVNIEDMAGWLCQSAAQASANYGIGQDGRIGMFVPENDRSWCSSNRENDHRAITIECASGSSEPYEINDKVYNALIDLMVDICKRYSKTKLIWFGDKEKTLTYKPDPDEMILSVHRWFANKSCPGTYIYNRLPEIADTVTRRLGGSRASGIPASKEDFIKKVGDIAVGLYSQTLILPEVVIAQCCLETGFGLGSDSVSLVQVNNLLGMKVNLINSTWKSVWNGQYIEKVTPEYYNGKLTYITDRFRKYTDYANCISDYEAFLLGVQNGKGYKYRRIAGMTDPAAVIHAIRIGTGTDTKPEGYCTDPDYETKVLKIIADYDLAEYSKRAGVKEREPVMAKWYRAAESYKDGKYTGQVGAFESRDNAVKAAQKAGVKAFDPDGNQIYPELAVVLPDRYVVRRRWSEDQYQIGAFSIKKNAKKLAKKTWGYRVYDLENPRKAIYTPKLTLAQKLCAACVRLNQWLVDDIAQGKNWRYYNSGHVSESTFWLTRKAGKLYTNCMGGVGFALKESGLPAKACSWYGQKGGGIRFLNDHAEADLRKYADIIKVKTKSPRQLEAEGLLCPGDILTFVALNHTCIYLGNGLSYDSGHAYCVEKGEGAHFVKWVGPLSWSTYKVGCIIRLR